MQKDLSILIPVYNGEKFLRTCLDSVLAQTLQNWELILIDDGSTDKSGEICDTYAAKDSRIRVIHQKNAGVSAARNAGLRAAQGEYIGFVDADDWIEPDMFGTLLRSAREDCAEIAMCDTVTVYSNGRKEEDTITQLPGDILLAREQMGPELMLELAGSACRCVYRRELLCAHEIFFPADVKFSEDRIFNLYAMGYTDRISYIKRGLYDRFVNVESAVHRFHDDYFEACKAAAEGTRKAIAEAWGNDQAMQRAYLRQFISGAFGAINNYFYRTAPLTLLQRVKKVRAVCDDEMLRQAIRQSGFGGIRGKWILKKRVWILCLCAQFLNWRHGR